MYPQLSHWQTNGFSPVCVRVWVLRELACEALYPQSSHWQTNGFSPVCVRLWTLSLPVVEALCPQSPNWQANGFSPECVRVWVLRWLVGDAMYPQPSHWQANGFSPVPHSLKSVRPPSVRVRVAHRAAWARACLRRSCPPANTPAFSGGTASLLFAACVLPQPELELDL